MEIKKLTYKGKEYKVQYNHTGKQNGRRTTVAFIAEPYVKDEPTKVIMSAVAECSNKDQFSKRIGRKISYGRLVKIHQNTL